MTKPQVKIVDVTTGQETVRDANAEELAQQAIDVTNEATRQAEAEAKEAKRLEILDRLGLTSDELKTILG